MLYNEFKARYEIATGEVLSGASPKQAHRLVQEWIEQRRADLLANWTRMESGQQMEYIAGLK